MISGIQAYQKIEHPPKERSEDRRIQGLAQATASGKAKESTDTDNRRMDRVSLSPEVEAAKLRESLGLPIRGKITKEIMENSRKAIEETVHHQIAQARQNAGIPEDAEILVRLTAKGDIRVNSGVKGSWELEKGLQEDKGFKEAFASLGMHQGLNSLGQTGKPEARQQFSAFFDAGEERSLSLISRDYNSLRQSADPLQALVLQARKQHPEFTFRHDNGHT
ncbi:hypothetical protein LZ24_02581 [Desulfobotulus alkaliphilus]|uniref:Uncharacterized protein n=1 Tax=Desulfobotulus alkaliphilus TaxID=622671 RepID=A0A562RGH8_9BACT|nr:hypothetical protein [Desulfobotulus alkaliphilus]TWI68207.1 hypothetical protein LZ24_02581 [Desulfobotulus alkaliphilus]